MPTVTFRPTGAASAEPSPFAGDATPVIVGSGYVNDDDDTTYVDASVIIGGTITGNSYKWSLGANPYAVLPADKSTVTSVGFAVRVKAETIRFDAPPFAFAGLGMDVRHNSATEYDWSASDALTNPGVTTEAWYDLSSGAPNGNPDLTDLSSVDWTELTTATDFELVFTPRYSVSTLFSTGTMTLRVYEVALDIIWEATAGGAPVGVVRGSPLRIHPRNDGRGTSSAPRIWPQPPTIQASPRRFGVQP